MNLTGNNQKNAAAANTREELALELKEAFAVVSPFIEKHTAMVCPHCENLCCKDRHGRYDEHDLVFLRALGAEIHPDQNDREESGPCRYMSEKGCSIERWLRPFRCTHFFCDALLKSLENDNAKLYRAFVEYLQYLIGVRQELLD
jgi:hypothetical protein